MMMWGSGWGGWFGPIAGIAVVIGVLFVVIWAIQRAGGGPPDDAMTALRSRFARGEIDAAQFEEMRRVVASTDRRGGQDWVGLIGLLLIVAAVVIWALAGLYGDIR